VVVDYIQPGSESLPERLCCTVTIGGTNIAEALVSKGFCSVVRYRQDDDRRSAAYDALMVAESRAEKKGLGVHSKNPPPTCKIADVSTGDIVKAKQFLPSLQRAGRLDALVEFVAAGSRLRVYIPRETCLITFLLSGISCPRGQRVLPSTKETVAAEPYGEEAHRFVRDAVLQREVEIEVESTDKGGNFIGYLFHNGANLSEMLVREGLAKVHFTAEKGNYYGKLKAAEEPAKTARLKVWENYVEEVVEEVPKEEEKEEEDEAGEEGGKEGVGAEKKAPRNDRKTAYKAVVVTELCKENLHLFCQYVDDGPKLEKLMEELNQDLSENPPLPGAFTPKKGEAVAAKFEDGQWYRARVESLNAAEHKAVVFYSDYGNKASVSTTNEVAPLPARFSGSSARPAFAHEFGLALVALPENDEEAKEDAFVALAQEVTSAAQILLNVEYQGVGAEMVTILNSEDKEDVVKKLIAEGLLLHDKSKMRERKLRALNQEYVKAQETAKEGRLNLWRYGDFTEDDAKEFGIGGRR